MPVSATNSTDIDGCGTYWYYRGHTGTMRVPAPTIRRTLKNAQGWLRALIQRRLRLGHYSVHNFQKTTLPELEKGQNQRHALNTKKTSLYTYKLPKNGVLGSRRHLSRTAQGSKVSTGQRQGLVGRDTGRCRRLQIL